MKHTQSMDFTTLEISFGEYIEGTFIKGGMNVDQKKEKPKK